MSKQQAILNAKKHYDAGEFQKALDITSDSLRNEPDKNLYLIQAGAETKLNLYKESQSSLEQGKSLLKMPEDDKLLFSYINAGLELGNAMLNEQQTKIRNEGLNVKIIHQRQLVEFFERKERWEKFVEEVESLKVMLSSDDNNFNEIEQVNLRVFSNDKLSADIRHAAAINIFTLSQFYNPKTKLTNDLYKKIVSLKPDSNDNLILGEKLLKDFDRKPAFSFYQFDTTQVQIFQQECRDFVSVCDGIFLAQDYSNPERLNNIFSKQLSVFFKYVVNATCIYEVTSDNLNQLISMLKSIMDSDLFKAKLQQQQEQTYPLNTLISIICDSYENNKQNYVARLPQNIQESELIQIRKIAEKRYTPLVNIFLCDHYFTQGSNYVSALQTAESGLRFINDLRINGFIKGFEIESKIRIVQCKILTSNKIDMKQDLKNLMFETSIKLLKQISSQARDHKLIQQEINKLSYSQKLQKDDWKGAKQILDEMEQESNEQDWIKSEKAWLTYSYLDQVAGNKEERLKMIEAIIILLKEVQQLNPKNLENLQRLGTIYFIHGQDLGAPAKSDLNYWLQGLKLDTMNGEIYYCLGLYYMTKEIDKSKSIKCLDKAVQLRPDIEDVGILYFKNSFEAGQLSQAYGFLENVQRVNPLAIYGHYLQGIRYQNQGQYTKAIEFYQNAARFQISQNKHDNRIKSSYPRLRDVKDVSSEIGNLFAQKLSIFNQSCIQIWINLTECYMQLEKYGTAAKCNVKMFKDLEAYIESQQYEEVKNNQDVNLDKELISSHSKILQLVNELSIHVDVEEEISHGYQLLNEILVKNKDHQLIEEINQGLAIAAKVQLKNKKYHQSFRMIQLGLNGLAYLQQSHQKLILEEYIGILIENLIILINENVGGKADRKKLEKAKYLRYLKQITEVSEQLSKDNERFQRLLCESYKIIGEELQSPDYIMKSIEILERINENSKILNKDYRNGLLLDLSKLYHYMNLIHPDSAKTSFYRENKQKIIRELIKSNSGNSDYWVYLGIFNDNDETKLRAFYQALKIKPQVTFFSFQHILIQDQFALNQILCLQLRQGNFDKAFKIMQEIRDIDSLNPLILSLMVILNARVALESKHLTSDQKKKHLLNSISIGEMFLEIEQEKIDQEEQLNKQQMVKEDLVDIHQYLSTQIFYMVSLLQFEINDKEVNPTDIEEIIREKLNIGGSRYSKVLINLLLKIQFQTKQIKNLKGIHDVIDQLQNSLQQKEDISKVWNKISGKLELLDTLSDKELIAQYIQTLEDFEKNPSANSATLLTLLTKQLHNNILLTKQQSNHLEKVLQQNLKDLEKSTATNLLNESLKLLFASNSHDFASIDDSLALLDSYQVSNIDLPAIEYEKLFKVYLLNNFDRVQFVKEYKKIQLIAGQNLQNYIKLLQQQQIENQNSNYDLIMKYPSNIKGYLKLLWNYLKMGQVEKCDRILHIAEMNIKSGIIRLESNEDKVFNDYRRLIMAVRELDCDHLKDINSFSSTFISLIKTYIKINSNDKQDSSNMDEIIEKVVKICKLFSQTEEIQEDMVSFIYLILQNLLQKPGFLNTYNEFSEKFLNSLSANQELKINPFFINEIQVYLLTNLSSSYITLFKMAAANNNAKKAQDLLNLDKSALKDGINLLQATLKLKVKNTQDVQKLLSKVIESSIEKDILNALLLFELKQYKNFYISCMQIVTFLKQSIAKEHDHVEKERLSVILGYGYYLKAIAEYTFMQARLQGVTLQEDFNEKESQTYNLEYFRRKSIEDIEKSKKLIGFDKQALNSLNQQLSQIKENQH